MIFLIEVSVDQNDKDIGRIAAELLMNRISGTAKENKFITLRPKLIVRKSYGEA